MFDTILDGFDEMEIYAFDVKRTSSKDIDYSKLDRYIDRAIFLEDDIIYLDEIEIQKDVLVFDTAELIEMFCYIYTDIKTALQEEEVIAEHIVSLGVNFKEKYLTYESSLFEKDSFEITKEILKERLDIIDKKSLLKDSIYDKYYDAIYTFLYSNPFFEGEDNIYWGIDNFAFIWEEMGHYYSFDKIKNKILFADTDRFETTNVGGKECYNRDEFKYPFVLNYEEKEKYFYPDLVLISQKCTLKNSIDQYIVPDKYQQFYKIRIHPIIIERISGEEKFKKEFGFKVQYNDNYIPIDQKPDYKDEKKRDNDLFNLRNKVKIYCKTLKINLFDFKYISIIKLKDKNDKIKIDIKKQLMYKLALQSKYNKLLGNNYFFIPSFSEKTKQVAIKNIYNSKIDVFYLNFKDAQKSYMEYEDDK